MISVAFGVLIVVAIMIIYDLAVDNKKLSDETKRLKQQVDGLFKENHALEDKARNTADYESECV